MEKKIFLLTTASRSVIGPREPVRGLSQRVNRLGTMINLHLHLVPKIKKKWVITSTRSAKAFVVGWSTNPLSSYPLLYWLCVCVCVYTYIHTRIHVYVCVYIYVYIYIHTHIHVYVCVLLSSHVFSSHIYYIFIRYTLINGNSVLTLGIYGYNLISITKKFPRYTPLIKCLSYSSYSFRDNINFIIHMNTIADCKMASYSTLVSVKTANPRIISMIARLSGCQPRAVHTGNKDTTAMAACK